MITTSIQNFSQLCRWLYSRCGIAVWQSIDLSNPGVQTFTPGDVKNKPHWRYSNTPFIITDPAQVFFITYRELRRFHVAIRLSGNGLNLKLTDASTRKVEAALEKAGSDATYEFDYETQEAIIFVADKKVSMIEHIKALCPEGPRLLCVSSPSIEGVSDPEITVDGIYRLVQENVYIMDREPSLSLIGNSGSEVTRRKEQFVKID